MAEKLCIMTAPADETLAQLKVLGQDVNGSVDWNNKLQDVNGSVDWNNKLQFEGVDGNKK